MNTLLPGMAVAVAVLAAAGHTHTAAPRAASSPLDDAQSATGRRESDATERRGARRLIGIAFAGALVVVIGPLPAMVTALSVAAIVRLRRISVQRQARRSIERDLPEMLDLFVLLLEAGVNPRGVIVEMSRRGPESTRPAFAHVADRLDIGEPFADAIVPLRTQLGPGATALVDLVTSSHRYGLPMAQVVGQLSNEARAARRRRNEATARALPVKLSFPLVVCTLPSFVLLAIVPAVMAALTSLGSEPW